MVAWRGCGPHLYACVGSQAGLNTLTKGARIMKTWRKPTTTEIAVGTEINAYACAAL